jgi:hypothetical protein
MKMSKVNALDLLKSRSLALNAPVSVVLRVEEAEAALVVVPIARRNDVKFLYYLAVPGMPVQQISEKQARSALNLVRRLRASLGRRTRPASLARSAIPVADLNAHLRALEEWCAECEMDD